MSDTTKIEWTDHTFNPWWGCSRVSPACRFCYADRDASRYGWTLWRRHGERRMLSEANWQRPLKWNRLAAERGVLAKVFCASMADVFEDHPAVEAPRRRLWEVIEATPNLRWQLLTKRPENVAAMVPWGSDWPTHVWIGTSVENQRFAERRIPILLGIPAAVRFLSCEPLLGELDLTPWLAWRDGTLRRTDAVAGTVALDWVIAGGESGPKSRETDLAWISGLVAQCRWADVPVFVKQMGAVLGREWNAGPKGGDWERWPSDIRVRQFPGERVAA